MAENETPGQPGSPYQPQQPYQQPYQQQPYQQPYQQQPPYTNPPPPQQPPYQQAPPQQPYGGAPYAGGQQPPYATPQQQQQPPPYAAGQQQPPYGAAPYQTVSADQREIWETKGYRALGFGAVWLFAGLVITVLTYSSAAGGGVYVVAWGPALYGIYRIFSGYRLIKKARN